MKKGIVIQGLGDEAEVLFEENVDISFSSVKIEEENLLSVSISVEGLKHISIPEIIIAIFSFTDDAFEEYDYSAMDIDIVDNTVSVLFDFDFDAEDIIRNLENDSQEILEISIFSSEKDEDVDEDSLFEVYNYDDIVIVKFPKEVMEDGNIDMRMQIAVSDMFPEENILTSFDAIETSDDMIFFYQIDDDPELVIGNFDPVAVNQTENFVVNIVPDDDDENEGSIAVDIRFSVNGDHFYIAADTEILYGLDLENVQIINFLKNLAEDILDADVFYLDVFCDINSIGVILEFDSELVEELVIPSDVVYTMPELDLGCTDDDSFSDSWKIPLALNNSGEISETSFLRVFSSKDDYSLVCGVKEDDIPDLVDIENISDIIEDALNQNILNGYISLANTSVIDDENIYMFDIIKNPDICECEFDDEDDTTSEDEDVKG